MAEKRTETIQCPYCGKQHEFDTYESIDLSLEPEMKEKILSEELFNFECEDCKNKAILAFPCLFSDMNHRYLIWLMGNYTPEQKKALDEDLENDIKNPVDKEFVATYNRRIVSSVNALKEKLIIFDEGLDDRVIEILKMICISEVSDQISPESLKEVLYNRSEDGKRFLMLIFMDRENPSVIEINQEMYDTTKDMFMKEIEKRTSRRGYTDVDAYWAKAVIEKTADKAESN